MTAISPTDEELVPIVRDIRTSHPDLGAVKLLSQLRAVQPRWTISEKRLRKILQSITVSTSEPGLIAETHLDPTLSVTETAPKVKARLFGGEKGKGLVAKERIHEGEVLWQEEPWIVTADSSLWNLLLQQEMCAQCFTLFNQRNPPLSVGCPNCDSAHFCNRLCLAKAQSSAHHPLLCPGQNPGALELLVYIHKTGSRHLEAVAKMIAKWRGEREWGSDASLVEQRVWSFARVNVEQKQKERREWEMTGEMQQKEWTESHMLLLNALNPPKSSKHHRSFHKLLSRHSRNPLQPLTSEEEERWYSSSSYLELLGLASLNQEDSGGLYALHAHINHSCEPNLMARNLPKSFVPPTDLPCSPPPPNGSGVRGTNKLTIMARRRINPGEELTLPYVNFQLERDDRRRMLRELYGFWCSCPRCLREK